MTIYPDLATGGRNTAEWEPTLDWLSRFDTLSWVDPYTGEWKDGFYGHSVRWLFGEVAVIPERMIYAIFAVAVLAAFVWCLDYDWRDWIARTRRGSSAQAVERAERVLAFPKTSISFPVPISAIPKRTSMGDLFNEIEDFMASRKAQDRKLIPGSSASFFNLTILGNVDSYDQETLCQYRDEFHQRVNAVFDEVKELGRRRSNESDYLVTNGPKRIEDIELIKRYISYLAHG